jgi:hypothetical protein
MLRWANLKLPTASRFSNERAVNFQVSTLDVLDLIGAGDDYLRMGWADAVAAHSFQLGCRHAKVERGLRWGERCI